MEWFRMDETEALTRSTAVSRSVSSAVRVVNQMSTPAGSRPASRAPAWMRATVSSITSGRSPVPAMTPSPMRPPRCSMRGPSAQIEIGMRARTALCAQRTRWARP